MTDPKNLEHTITEAQGTRLDRWLRRQYKDLSQGLIEKLIREGKIRVNGQKVTANYRLQNQETVKVPAFIASLEPRKPLHSPKSVVPFTAEDFQALASWILWEDEEMLVLNKPYGLAVQGGSKTVRHLDGLLSAWGHKTNCTYRLVHRLDKETTGVLVVAKTAAMAAHLAKSFQLGLHEKIYWAVVIGFASPGQGTIDDRLIKGAGPGEIKEKMRVDPQTGQTALTIYRTLKKLSGRSLPPLTCLELRPQTGRTHQLRVHCAHKGFPILGDRKYGEKQTHLGSTPLHLHARSLTLKDQQGHVLTFVAPPPQHIEETLEAYKINWAEF